MHLAPRPAPRPLQAVIGRLSSLAFAAEAQVAAVGQSLQAVFEAGQRGEVPEQLYTEGPLSHEFPRTVSRLNEMQSEEFLALERRDVDTSLT